MNTRFSMNSLCCAIVLAFAVTLVACQSDDDKLAEFYANGQQYDQAEKYQEAVIEYKNVLKINPNHADAHYQLAKAYLKLNRTRDAYWEMSETVRLDPANVEAVLSFGALSLIAKDADQALAMGLLAIKAEPENYQAHLLAGQALQRLKRESESEAYYLKAVELEPKNFDVLLNLAAYYAGLPDGREKAEPWFQKGVEVFHNFRARTALAKFLVQDPKRVDEAEVMFKEVVDKIKAAGENREKHVDEGYSNLAKFYFATQRNEEAVAALEKGVEANPDSTSLLFTLATYYRTQANPEKAEALIRQATKIDSSDAAPFLVLSSFLGGLDRIDDALHAAEQALAAEPDNVNAKLRRAEVLLDLGYREVTAESTKMEKGAAAALAKANPKIQEGLKIAEAILVETPFQPQAEFVRGKAYMATQEIGKGIEAFRAAAEGRPDWAQVHFALGSAMASQQEFSLARVEIARALELDPQLHKARKILASLHQSLGEHEYAIEQARRYLEYDPNDNATRILVAQSLIRLGKRKDALDELKKVPVDKRDAGVLFALGRIEANLADPAKARDYLMQVLALSPHNAKVLRTLFTIDQKNVKDFAETKGLIVAAAKAKPDDGALAQLHGMVLFANRDMKGAETEFIHATELAPDDVEAYQQLARFYAMTGRTDETIATYEKAVKAKPTSARLHHFLALLYEAQGELDKAQKSYELAIKYDENHAFAKNNLAYLLADRGQDLDRALDLAQDAKALLPNDANAADTLGWVLFKRGVNGAAVGYLKEAVEDAEADDPALGVIRHHLAQAYEADGNPKRAVEVLKASIDDLEQRNRAERAQGRNPQSPPWEGEVRNMLKRLQSA